MWRILPPWKHNKYHWSHFSLPSLCRAFAFFHSFHPTPPTLRSVWLVGGPFPSFPELGGSLGVSNDGWELQGSAGRKQLNEGRPLLQEGSCTPASNGERKSLGNKDEVLSPANERRSRCTHSFLNPALLPFQTLFFFYCLNFEGETPLQWKKPGVLCPPSLTLLSPSPPRRAIYNLFF